MTLRHYINAVPVKNANKSVLRGESLNLVKDVGLSVRRFTHSRRTKRIIFSQKLTLQVFPGIVRTLDSISDIGVLRICGSKYCIQPQPLRQFC